MSRSELERRREELAAQVAELHWDLGGLVYEMAIRDHFRNDVLLQRAARLQELDTELAEVERRLGAERASGGDARGGQSGRARWARVLPPAQVCALLLVVFLACGVALGAAAKGSRSQRARPREVLVARAPAAAAPPATAKAPPPTSKEEPTPKPSSAPEPTTESAGTGASSASGNTGAKSSPPASPNGSKPSSGAAGNGSSGGGAGEGSASAPTKLPPIKHVFVVMLSDEPYATAFGPSSPAQYVTGTLEKKGELLVRYYAVAHEELANEVALISGQGPTAQTAQNCPTYEALTPGTVGAEGQVSGQGCVYPAATQTLAGQLAAKHLTWKAYLEGMDESPAAAPGDGACGHPALGAADPTSAQTPPPGQAYATWRNPFVYFHSVIDAPACASDDVGLSTLKADLAGAKRTPTLSYIVPDRCDDGNPTPCASGQAGGMAPVDPFLQKVVPEILASSAYKESGLLVLTTDEAPTSGEFADSSSCCGQPSFPNVHAPTSALGPTGGGEVGALLLSPFVKGGLVSQEPYNHFSLLRTIEDLFGISHLGYAAAKKVSSFAPAMFTASRSH